MKSPAFAFYVRDWLCSRKVANMNGDAVKAYIYLLCEAWLQEDRATLPNDEKELASMARINNDKWCVIKDDILKCFFLNKDGRLVNERLFEVHKLSEIRTLNRKNKKRTKTQQKHNKTVTACEDEIEDENINSSFNAKIEDSNINKDTYDERFLDFWNVYPRKVGKGAAWKSWQKIPSPAETLEKIKEALTWQTKSEQWTKQAGEFIPHPTTYLNQRRWDDEKIEERIKYI